MVKKVLRILLWIFLFTLFLFSSTFLFASFWLVNTWGNLNMEEIIFHIKAPMQGANYDVVKLFLSHYMVPVLVFFVILLSVFLVFRKKKLTKKLYIIILPISSVLIVFSSFLYLNHKLAAIEYLKNQNQSSDFIENNYVDPATTKIEFPEKKRNLIYIYLESTEITFADNLSGGAFKNNVIPELTEIALENECFSGNSSKLNGGLSMEGSTWTMGAMFAHTSGLPLKIGLGNEALSKQETFFPSLITLGDILESEGYTNEFMCGSKSGFGGRALYLKEHGNYKIFDHDYAIKKGLIPEDYMVWWGYEDEKLFEFAKSELTDLSESSEPFNFTILTADTHFENGFLCRLCTDEYGTDRYSNVFACSSRQVSSFIEWCTQQDFYENTTIIVVGDHLTMDSNYCDNVSEGYIRKTYLACINAPIKPADPTKMRFFTTMDMFPTTIAALGAKIDGDRLGLGTNLYSEKETLLEQYGYDSLNSYLSAKSTFMESLSNVEVDKQLIQSLKDSTDFSYTLDASETEDSILNLKMFSNTKFGQISGFQKIYAKVSYDDKNIEQDFIVDSKIETNSQSTAEIPLPDITKETDISVTIYICFEDESYELWNTTIVAPYLHTRYINKYLQGFPKGSVVIIAAKDDMSRGLNYATLGLLRDLGIESDLPNGFRHGFIAVITDEGVQYEKMDNGCTLSYSGEIGKIKYSIKSSGYDDENISSIIINGEEYSPDQRGLNFVVCDPDSGEILSVASFDTYKTGCPINEEKGS